MDTHSIIKQLTEQLSISPGQPGFFIGGTIGRFGYLEDELKKINKKLKEIINEK